MKILIVNASDIVGGAARAAYRLHKSLLANGVDSQMLVQSKISDDFTVLIEKTKFIKYLNKTRPLIDRLPVMLFKKRTQTYFSPSWLGFSRIVDKINRINPDIVHLHWVCGGMMRIEDITRIKAPIVWSLHDMWAFTGGCHYAGNCNAYENECGNCKVLGSIKKNDLSRKIWHRKKKSFIQVPKLVIIGLSGWLTDCANKSTLFKGCKAINLPNPIDTDKFKVINKNEARELWNLPKDKKLVLFGAIGATSDPRKGARELNEALHELKDNNIEYVIFGSSEPKRTHNNGFKTHYLGYLHDDVSLVTLYCAVDVMIVPSLQEAFGQTASEAMACGTPVVAFGHTGLLDIIDHKLNGYLAKPFDISDLKDGIEWVLNSSSYDELCRNARKKVLERFDSTVVAKQYIELYKEILVSRVDNS
jgi:glycosyltransferase involved in cell wall biosynthesis